jgi:putative transposase
MRTEDMGQAGQVLSSVFHINSLWQLVTQHPVRMKMPWQGAPKENASVERLISIIKEEMLYLAEYQDLARALMRIKHLIDEVYQKERIHSALGYLTSAEYGSAYWGVETRTDNSPTVPLKSV